MARAAKSAVPKYTKKTGDRIVQLRLSSTIPLSRMSATERSCPTRLSHEGTAGEKASAFSESMLKRESRIMTLSSEVTCSALPAGSWFDDRV
jgi:hypothetical protein